MTKEFQDLMYTHGIFRYYCGYDYLEQAVLLVMEEPERLHNLGEDIYKPVAEKYQTSVKNVEKNIRTIRDYFVQAGGMEYLMKQTGYWYWRDKKPYPRELIELLADYLSRDK